MKKRDIILKPIGTFEPLSCDSDPMSAEFRYVADHSRRFGIGPLQEKWNVATFPNINREIQSLNATGRPADTIKAKALQEMADKIEPTLDFSDDFERCNPFAMHAPA